MKLGLMMMASATLSLSGLAASETAVEAPTFALPKMAAAPVIDGDIGEAEWRDATEALQFIPLHADTVFPGEARVRFGRDDRNFYIAARMLVSPHGIVQGPPPPTRRGNGGVLQAFGGDCFEFDFTSDKTAAKESVLHMIVSSTGCYYSTGTANGLPISWDPPSFKTASKIENGFWSFEYSIPLAEIGFKSEESAVHAVRIARDWKYLNSSGFGIQSSLAPFETSFEKAGCCVLMPFMDEAPVVKLLDLGIHGHEGNAGVQSYPVKLSIRNVASAPRKFKVRLFGKPVNSQPMLTEKVITLAAGEEQTVEDRGAVLSDEKVFLRTTVSSEDGQTLYYDRSFNFQPGFAPIRWMRHDAKGPEIELKHAYFPSDDRIRVRAELAADKKHGKGATVHFAILRKDGSVVTAYDAQANDQAVVDVIFPTGDLAAETRKHGTCEYRLVMNAPQVEGGVKTNAFIREVFEWEGNKLGLSDVVPKPFEKVKREKVGVGEVGVGVGVGEVGVGEEGKGEFEKVSVVLREHIVDTKTGLWQQVFAAGKPVLARPMRWVRLQSDSTAIDGRRLPSIAIDYDFDIDGLCKWRLTLPPGHYEPLALEIPVKAERAPLMHSCTDGIRITYAGCVPAGEGVVWKSSQVPHVGIIGDYVPYIWVGGTLRGISVFGENDKGWVVGEVKSEGTPTSHSNSLPCTEVIREADGTVVIRLNLIQRTIDLTAPRTITLGLMATPTKPMPENWRAHDPGLFYGSGKCWGCGQTDSDVCPWDGTDVFWQKLAATRRTGIIDAAFLDDAFAKFPYAGAPGSADRAQWTERVQRHFRSGFENARRNSQDHRPITWYTNARGVDFSTKQGQTFCDEWNRQEWMGHDFNLLYHRDYDLDPCRSFRDYAAWWYAKALSLGAVENYYWDDIYLCPNYNLSGTDAYRLEDGTIQPATGIFNMRELVKRCAMVQAELGRPCQGNWVHMTSTAIAPILSFAGLNYDLEDGGSVNDFQDRYGRDYLLACTIGRQHGNYVSAMGYFGKTSVEERRRLDRCGTGVMLVHEIRWDHSATWREWDARLRKWGYRSEPTVKVWNDFDEDVPYPTALAGVPAYSLTMYNPKRREAMVIVSDWGEGGEVAVRPDPGAIGIPARFRAYDFESGAEIPVKNGVFKLTLKKHDFAAIVLK